MRSHEFVTLTQLPQVGTSSQIHQLIFHHLQHKLEQVVGPHTAPSNLVESSPIALVFWGLSLGHQESVRANPCLGVPQAIS